MQRWMTEQSWVAAAAASLYQSYKYQVGAMADADLCKYQHVGQATGIPLPQTLETNKQTNKPSALNSSECFSLGRGPTA
jgi:hypothetical protein